MSDKKYFSTDLKLDQINKKDRKNQRDLDAALVVTIRKSCSLCIAGR